MRLSCFIQTFHLLCLLNARKWMGIFCQFQVFPLVWIVGLDGLCLLQILHICIFLSVILMPGLLFSFSFPCCRYLKMCLCWSRNFEISQWKWNLKTKKEQEVSWYSPLYIWAGERKINKKQNRRMIKKVTFHNCKKSEGVCCYVLLSVFMSEFLQIRVPCLDFHFSIILEILKQFQNLGSKKKKDELTLYSTYSIVLFLCGSRCSPWCVVYL